MSAIACKQGDIADSHVSNLFNRFNLTFHTLQLVMLPETGKGFPDILRDGNSADTVYRKQH